ncbi:hypothetical protein [Streptomyces sp. NPDC059874]|uniref:hypothetical protein n=1 Tax=Streptomyces sp. NPDC059874 TaxID=3346983 RepID=UPI00365C12BE
MSNRYDAITGSNDTEGACGLGCHLAPEHLKFGDKHAHLVLGRHPVLLPPRLAKLLRRLAEQLTQRLGRHGIPVRTARNAALAALAADLPSPTLADVTGMHRHTALRWVAYARRYWAEYLAAGAEDLQRPPEGRGCR